MKLELIRKVFAEQSTVGDLLMDGKFFSYVLEDCVREIKIPNETAIPYGIYEVIINWSARFKQVMPLLLNVPGFEGVRIHFGNDAADTSGCLLLGYIKNPDFVGQSKKAFLDFMPLLKQGLGTGKVFIEIIKEIKQLEKV